MSQKYSPWLARLYTLDRYVSRPKLVAMADEAARRGDSEFVAFAALNLGPTKDALRLADRAVAANPDLTWIYFPFVSSAASPWEWEGPSEIAREDLARRIDRLETFDPENAAPHILRAGFIKEGRGKEWPSGAGANPNYLDALARETAWCQEMDKAFRSPRFDLYLMRRFLLFRRVLRARGWDHPVVMATTWELSSIPNLFVIRDYTNLLVLKYGAEAEAAGKLKEALVYYFRAAEVGDRLRLQGNSLIEELWANAVQRITYPKLAGALRKAGREEEARLAEDADRQTLRDLRELRNQLRATSYQPWLVLLVNLAAGLVAVFFVASTISVGYVNAKLWVRREKKGKLYQTLTISENYAPLLLFLSSLALYLSNVPFARNYEHYMTVEENLSSEIFTGDMYPAWGLSELNPLEVPNAFQDYVPVALGGVILLTGVLAFARWRESRKEALPEPAAFERKLRTQNYAILLLIAVTTAAFAVLAPPWDVALTVGTPFALVMAGALWASAGYARRTQREEKPAWGAKATEAGAYLLLVVVAGVSGLAMGALSSDIIRYRAVSRKEWESTLALVFAPLVAGAVSATRLRFRRLTPAIFTLIVISVMAWMNIDQWRSQRKSQVAKTTAPARPSPNVPPTLTEAEVLVSLEEGKPAEEIVQAATTREIGFYDGIMGLWVLREAGADEKLIKSLRAAEWAEYPSFGTLSQQFEEAEKALRADIKQQPKNALLHFALGLTLDWNGNAKAAIEEYRAALRLNPNSAGAHRALGRTLAENKELRAAIAELRQAVRLDPRDALAHRDLALALGRIRDQDGAILEYKRAKSLEPDDYGTLIPLGQMLKEKGRFQEAISEFREALRHSIAFPIKVSAQIDLAEALNRYGDQEQAIAEYRQLLRLAPDSGEGHNGLGEVLAERGELTAAIAQFREAIQLDTAAMAKLREVLAERGQLGGLLPEFARPHNNLGLALERAGDLGGAIAEFQKAVQLDANYADAHASLARALEEKGDLKGASEENRIARRLRGKSSPTGGN